MMKMNIILFSKRIRYFFSNRLVMFDNYDVVAYLRSECPWRVTSFKLVNMFECNHRYSRNGL